MPRPSNPPATVDISSPSTPSPLHRLPVNPRRKKVAPDERKRVATACNSCNVRRIKCSGERPCRQCASAQRECLYPEPIERVTIPRSELESLQRRCASLERQLAVTERSGPGLEPAPPRPQPVASSPRASASSRADFSAGADAPRPIRPGGIDGRMLADPTGASRFLGETSGATFLDALKELIVASTPLVRALNDRSGNATPAGAAFLGSVGQYQTYDSRPMMLPQLVDPLVLPSEPDMAAALSRARYFIQDGNGAFPSGGITFWPFDDPPGVLALAAVPSSVHSADGRALTGPHHRPLALYHATFAVASLLKLTEPGSAVDGQLGEASFARARALFGNLLDRTTYTIHDIATLAMMAVYYVNNNRRDAAYMAISNAMTISVMNGIHRGKAVNEIGVRTFWTVYVLDRWLGCVMGRPPGTPDDAITLPLPRECPGLPSPVGLRAHVELCKISDYIVYSSYRETGLPDLLTKSTVRVDKALEMLQHWRANLPPPLCLPDPLTLLPADLFTQASAFEQGPAAMLSGAAEFGTDRACWALHMSCYQLIILSVRPTMLMAAWKAVASIFCISQPFDIETHPSISPIRACSDAARCNLRLGRLMRLHSPRQKLLMPDLHHIFNAAIVLMMHQIIFVNLRTQDLDDVGWAIEVFEAEAETGSEYGKDCTRVLRDFNYLAQRLRGPVHDPETKHVLLSDERLLHELMSNELMTADVMAEVGGNGPGSTGDDGAPPAQQAGHGGLYHRAAVMYQTLSSFWKADYMVFYNTFVS